MTKKVVVNDKVVIKGESSYPNSERDKSHPRFSEYEEFLKKHKFTAMNLPFSSFLTMEDPVVAL